MRWDLIVIGAGPAGSTAACFAARRGLDVLLLDRASFPRPKVCGCCINAQALSILREMGADGLVAAAGAVPLDRLELRCGSGAAVLTLHQRTALSRSALDWILIRQAVRTGAEFIPSASATVRQDGSDPVVEIAGSSAPLSASCIIAADGLSGRSLDHLPTMAPRIGRGSRAGFACSIPDSIRLPRGTIRMTASRHGYIGMVVLEDGSLDVAAAIDPAFVRSAGGPGPAALQILASARVPGPGDLTQARWRGTPALTRWRPVEAGAVLVVGDAAAYVEPFTGEGIAWATMGGRMAVRHAAAMAEGRYRRGAWSAEYRRLMRARQAQCRLLAAVLRRPGLTRAAVALLRAAPIAAAPFLAPRCPARLHLYGSGGPSVG
jgi:flavin-dependent dehydrogenase